MTTHHRDTSLGEGVYFASDDYVGIMRRVVILVVDLAVLVVVYFALATPLIAMTGDLSETFLLIYCLCVWAYLTVLKASTLRTVGYRLTGSRILNLRGQRPSIYRMTFRLLLWAFGPFNLFDPNRMASDLGPIQWHPGTVRFLKEKGMWPPKG